MEWFKKFFGRDDYLSDQEKFAVSHRASNAPRCMTMLAGSSKPLEYAIYIRIPEQLRCLRDTKNVRRLARAGL